MSQISDKTWDVRTAVDVQWLAGQGMRFAMEQGLDDAVGWKVAIVIQELLSNVLKFAGQGRLSLTWLDAPRPGLRVVVEDEGPGILDLDCARQDGFSEGRFLLEQEPGGKRRGLGAGLGTVERMMDWVEFENKQEGGLRVSACLWAIPL